jgi:hypothetical protein
MQTVYRAEDMSRNNWLSVTLQDDGDIIVGMFIEENMGKHGTAFPSVEFCSISAGGGRSARTLKALRELMEAIRLDNLKNPIESQPKDMLDHA